MLIRLLFAKNKYVFDITDADLVTPSRPVQLLS